MAGGCSTVTFYQPQVHGGRRDTASVKRIQYRDGEQAEVGSETVR
jgi:hypothetical protein